MNQINWEKIGKGLEKYVEIMTLYKCSSNISKDELFQKKYRIFYGINAAHKSADFCNFYFNLLHKLSKDKNDNIQFILKQLLKIENTKELSFGSKMIATFDTSMPVWDKNVRRFLNFKYKTNFKDTYKEISECIEAYDSLCNWYKLFLKSPEAKALISEFDIRFPKSKISKIKKIDFIFWQTSIK